MKIDPSALTPASSTRHAAPDAAATTAPGPGAAASASTQDSIVKFSAQIHALPGTAGGEFDAARVAEIREDIRAGRYEIHPERIASGLLDSVRSMLGNGNNE